MEFALASALLVIGLIVLVASLDDLAVDLLCRLKLHQPRFQVLPAADGALADETAMPHIAIFVANWHEADVLEKMVEGNLAKFRNPSVKFVLGVYPNDIETRDVALALAQRYPQFVEVIVNRRDGPTSKGQMLNEMFARAFSKPAEAPDLVVLHDSEDVIAPRSFEVYARESVHHAMIQIPIFSIDSRDRSLVAATYMEEFAERHTGEMLLRQKLGAFVPSAGVGTCLRKDMILHFLAARGHVLQPGSVTEDYILGAEAQMAGFSTAFAAYRDGAAAGAPLIATVEYFPKEFWASVRQRTRWTFGIGFESARRLGWFGSPWNRFFLYRDRKGAIANFLPLVSLVVLIACLAAPPDFSAFETWQRYLLIGVLAVNSLNIVLRVFQKSVALKAIYGAYDVMGLVVRWPVALVINAIAAGRAWRSFLIESARASKPIAWAKTKHELPASFDISGARPVPVHAGATASTGGRPAASARRYSNVLGGSFALACFALLVAGGLRIFEPLIAPISDTISDQVAGVDAALSPQDIDLQERRAVESAVLSAGMGPIEASVVETASAGSVDIRDSDLANLQSTTRALAELSITQAEQGDLRIWGAAIPSALVDDPTRLAALIDDEDTKGSTQAIALTHEHDPAAGVALRATATALAEFSLAGLSENERVIYERARPAMVIDAIALLEADEAEQGAVAAETNDAAFSAPILKAERGEVERLAAAAIGIAVTRDQTLLQHSAANPVVAMAPASNVLSDDEIEDLANAQADASQAYRHGEIEELARVTIAATGTQEAALLDGARASVVQAARPKREQVAAPLSTSTKARQATAKRKIAAAAKVKSKKSRRKNASVQSGKAKKKSPTAASKTVTVQPAGSVRSTTFLRRRCQGSGCQASGGGNASSSAFVFPKPS